MSRFLHVVNFRKSYLESKGSPTRRLEDLPSGNMAPLVPWRRVLRTICFMLFHFDNLSVHILIKHFSNPDTPQSYWDNCRVHETWRLSSGHARVGKVLGVARSAAIASENLMLIESGVI